MIGCDKFILLVYFCAPPLRAFRIKEKEKNDFIRRMRKKKEEQREYKRQDE